MPQRITSATAFTVAARRYWLEVYPVVRRETRLLHAQASQIPDPGLRQLALHTQTAKWPNLEGAAAFAAFVAPAQRREVARLLAGYQAAYDYADTLMEQPNPTPALNARQLHAALPAILQPRQPQPDYYRHHPCEQDGGYLTGLVRRCRTVIDTLPAYPSLATSLLQSAQRGVEYQSRVALSSEEDHLALHRRATVATPHHRLRWWETWAACGSSLHTLALLAQAANPAPDSGQTRAIDALYWPWAGALHGLLDCLVDQAEDHAHNRPNLLDLYPSSEHAARRLGFITRQALRHATAAGPSHRLILAGMVSLYLSDGQAWIPAARPITDSVLAALGEDAKPAMLTLRARRLTHRRGTRNITIVPADHPV